MNTKHLILAASSAIASLTVHAETPWNHGALKISADSIRIEHEDGHPFFWLADTGWLLPERLNRDEARQYIDNCADAGFNVIQVQTINGVPATNAYGRLSHPDGWNMAAVEREDSLGYWQHMDYIIDTAAERGIYIGMVCIWGGLVKHGYMDQDQARIYGSFLANRYKDKPNIVWIIGGDTRGDVKPEVWSTLATTINTLDNNHLMTFHPFGRTNSAWWWNDAHWIDFNMFQSGHRAYDQTKGDGADNAFAPYNEDNWRYVNDALSRHPLRPVIDGEPSYEGIPHGLHDTTLPRWQDCDARRYAYWSVLSGAAGHTYGNNSVMQFHSGDRPGAYGADRQWRDAINDPGRNQMKYLKQLVMSHPGLYPCQDAIIGNGERYERAVAARNDSSIIVYAYTDRPVTIDLSTMTGRNINVDVLDPRDGAIRRLGLAEDDVYITPSLPDMADRVYILTSSEVEGQTD